MKIAKNVCMILCDDIREEKGGKLSYLGVYGIDKSNVIPDKIPAILPKLCLAVMLSEARVVIEKCTVTIILPGKEKLELKYPEPPNNVIGQNLTLGVLLTPFKINSSGEVKVFIRFNDEKKPSLKFTFGIHLKDDLKK